MTASHQLINQDSGRVEYYTDPVIIEAARRTMGSIDLDPASCARANETGKAKHYFTKDDDGLSLDWYGNVWLNHPFSREYNKAWVDKLHYEYMKGSVDQACSITFAATSEIWTERLFEFPICFLSPRTNYYLPDGTKKKGVTKGSMVTYMGPYVDRFVIQFRDMGRVMLPAKVAA